MRCPAKQYMHRSSQVPGQEIEVGSDGLPVLVQGPWSKDKLYFVRYFSSVFNGGMKNDWQTRAYVDLFSGPGLCKDRETDTEYDGSPLIALQCPTPFTHLFFNDIDDKFVEALKKRQERLRPQARIEYFNADCNLAARQIAEQIPRFALTLAFIDPWNYELTFDGLAQLGKRRATDLIVTFHGPSIKRNARLELARVDSFLDDQDWRNRYWDALGNVSQPPTTVLIDTFRNRLRGRLGYTQFGEPMPFRNSKGATIFYLLFASKNPRGLDFWEKSTTRLRSGQRTLQM